MTIGIGLVAAVIGALASVRQVARMPPAEAMRPPAPLRYRRSALERLGAGSLIGPSAMMIAREIGRRPLRFLLSVAGIAMGVAIFVMGRFSWDSFDNVMGNVFVREHREDMIVSFVEPQPRRALRTLEAVPGVLLAEGQRTTPVRFRAGSRSRDAVLVGLSHPSELRQLVHDTSIVLVPPPDGVIMTDRLAGLLGVRPGDQGGRRSWRGAGRSDGSR